jgi:glutamine cyclotransferase
LRIVNAKTGEIIRKTKVGKRYFAEGIVVHDKKVYMLTWKSKTVLVYDAESLELLRGLSFESSNGEGWGFTSDGTHFIASDGSSTLTYFLPPAEGDKSLTVAKRVQVVDPESGKPVTQINELQFVEGYLYANIWYRDIIVQIDAATGEVVRKFDMSALYPHRQRAPGADCLNGIAFNSQDGTFLVTGKKWPLYYTVRLAAADALDSEHNGDKLHRSGGRGGGSGGGADGAARERGLSVDDNVSLDL